jgi:cytoskeletal protein RodZ
MNSMNMKTVGQILREERLKKGISLEEVDRVTKIRKKYLELLENNDFPQIGQATTVRGFIKNYGEFLELSTNLLLAIFRRDFAEDKIGQVVLRGLTQPLNQKKFFWNPRKTLVLISILFGLLFLGYLGFQVFSLKMIGLR